MDKNFYTTPKGYYQIANNILSSCEHKNFKDTSGYTFFNGIKTLKRECIVCGSSKVFSSYK